MTEFLSELPLSLNTEIMGISRVSMKKGVIFFGSLFDELTISSSPWNIFLRMFLKSFGLPCIRVLKNHGMKEKGSQGVEMLNLLSLATDTL